MLKYWSMSEPISPPVNDDYVARIEAENRSLKEDLDAVKTQLDWFKRQLFGQKSEKRHILDPSVQGDLFAGQPVSAPSVVGPTPDTETITYQRRRKTRDNAVTDQGLRFDDTVPVQTIELPIPPELADLDTEQISEKITYRLAQRPVSYVVLKYVRPVLKETATGQLHTTKAPDNVLDKSVFDVSVLSGLLVDKFTYHLPLYRQHQRLAQNGITLARSTLIQATGRAIDLLQPIVDSQFQSILRSRVLAMDETPIKAGKKASGKMHQGQLWPVYGDQQEINFHYTPTRGAQQIKAILGQAFDGTLLTDGYAAYENYAKQHPKVTHAACWAHCRRTFEKAQQSDPTAVAQALDLIGQLYHIEQQIRDKQLDHNDKLNYRTKHS